MGLLAWLFADAETTSTESHNLRRIPLDKIDYHQEGGGWLFGHTPDIRRENRGLLKEEGPPIEVHRKGARYRVWDGNDRVYWGREAGRTHIWAEVLD